jgi:hypothetical protein
MNEWNDVINSDLKDAEFTGGTPIPDGTYEAHVSNVAAKTFKAGSKGVEVEYTVLMPNSKPATIKDYFVVRLADGSPNKTGAASIKKLMLECGLTPEAVLKFNFPAFDSKSFGDFKKLLDEPLTVIIKSTEQKKGVNAGKSFPRVKSFTQRNKLAA